MGGRDELSRQQRWLRFIIGGGVNTAFTYGVYLALNFAIGYQFAYLIAYILGIMFAYYFNAKMVFQVALSWKGLFTYPLVYIVQYIVSAFGLGILVEIFNISKKVAPLVVTIVMLPLTYIMSKLIIKLTNTSISEKQATSLMFLKNKIYHEEEVCLLDFLKYLLVTSFSYWLINFVLTPNTLSPLHQDDYFMLGAGYENLRWLVERPVSTNLVYIMGGMGAIFSFALVNLLTVIIPTMVLFLVSQLLKVKLGVLSTIAFSVMVFSHMAAFEHGKFLGLITNLTSHFFGCLTLIAVLYARQKKTLVSNTFAVISYGLSIFAKEDFLIPPLLLLGYFGADLYFPSVTSSNSSLNVTNDKLIEKKWWLKIIFWFLAFDGFFILFSLLVRNPFIAGAVEQVGNAELYAVNFHPSVLILSFQKLTIEYCIWQTAAGILATIFMVVFWRERWRELLLLVVIVFCLILPYALIPNRILPYRVFAWLPWLSALVVIGIPVLWRHEIVVFSNRIITRAFAVIFFLVPFLVGYMDSTPIPFLADRLNYTPRLTVAGWYEAQQRLNKQMLESLVANKALLDKEEAVGIIGVEGLSPWSNTDGSYLQKKLGFKNRWVVFVDKSSMFFTITAPHLAGSTYVSVFSSKQLCEQPQMLVMKFDSSGMGTPLRASKFCSTSNISH